MKRFYSHIVEYESVIVALDELALSKQEKIHLANLADATLHSSILDVILGQLSEADKEEFVRRLNEGNHDKIWQFLNSRIDKVEDKIKAVAEDIKDKLHEDIKEAKGKIT